MGGGNSIYVSKAWAAVHVTAGCEGTLGRSGRCDALAQRCTMQGRTTSAIFGKHGPQALLASLATSAVAPNDTHWPGIANSISVGTLSNGQKASRSGAREVAARLICADLLHHASSLARYT